MPQRQLNDWLDSYLEYTHETEPRESYRLWVGISTIASILQRKCWFQLGSEVWYPNFYIILAGPPAARKGTAMRPGETFLRKMGLDFGSNMGSLQKLINKLEGTYAMVPDPDNPNVQIVHSSLTIIASELTVFLKGDDKDMISVLCKWFDCEYKFTYETISRGDQHIPNVWINLLGATTPSTIQRELPPEAFGSGLISRTIFVYEDNKEKLVILPYLPDELGRKLEADLETISEIKGRFRVDNADKFFEAYTAFRYDTEENPPIRDPKLSKYNDRRPMHLMKLCMIVSAARTNDRIITVEDFHKALGILKAMEEKMPRTFAGVGTNPVAAIQTEIMGMIYRQKEIPVKSLMALYYNDISDVDLQKIIATLGAMGYITYDVGKKLIKYNPAFSEEINARKRNP